MTVDLQKLTEPFPQTAIKQRQGGGGRALSYVEGHTVIHRLIAATENNYSFRVLAIETRTVQTQRGTATLVTATVELELPGLGARQHIGVQMVNDAGGEDLVKGAITDALKKAATLFGIGLELYGPDYESGEIAAPVQRSTPRPAPPQYEDANDVPFDGPPLDMEPSAEYAAVAVDTATEPQIRLMAVLISKAAIDIPDARQVLKERYGKASRTLLTKGEASDFIDWLQSQQPREQPALVN